MATADTESFVQQVKEMRALRMQQLKQQSADQRYQTSMLNYQRSVIRSNEKIVSSLASLGNKITSTVTGLVSAIGKTGGAAAGAAVTGVSKVSTSIVDGIIQTLPLAIGGLLAKVFLWDNMSGDTKTRLSNAFGKLFGKLFSYVQDVFDDIAAGLLRTVNQLKKAYEGLDIKFPMFDKIGKKLSIFFEIVQESMKVVSSYAEEMFSFVKENPKTALAAALGAYLSPQILAVLGSIAAGVITTSIFKGVLTRQLGTMLATAGAGTGMATGRTLSEAMGARGAAQFAEKTGLALGENVYVGEGGQPIVDSSGKAIARTSPGMTPGQKVLTGVRAIGSRALSVTAGALNIAGAAMLALEPIGGRLDFETWETEKGVMLINAPDSPARTEMMTTDDDSNMVALAYALRQAAEERGKDLKPGAVLVISKAWVYRAKGKGNKISFLSMQVGIVSPEIVTYPNVYAERRESYEKMVDDLRDKLIRENEVQTNPKDQGTIPGAQTTRTSGESISGLASFIQKYESGPAGYEQMFLNPRTNKPFVESPKPLTQMTVGEIKQLQAEQVRLTKEAGIGKDASGKVIGTGAIGRYQLTQSTLASLLKSMGIKDDAIFDKALQDKLFVGLIGKSYQDYMSGVIDVDQFTKIVKQQWEAFRTPKAEKELKEYLVKLKKEAGTDTAVVVDEKGQVIPKGDLIRQKALKRLSELLPEFMKDEDILGTPIVTSGGKDVGEIIKEKAGSYFDKRKQSIRDRMREKLMEADPEALKNTLIDTLKITKDVVELQRLSDKDGLDVPHSTIINNITNNNSSTQGSGYTKDVYPAQSRNKFEHRSLAGIITPP